jgi:hypothetical protein
MCLCGGKFGEHLNTIPINILVKSSVIKNILICENCSLDKIELYNTLLKEF